MSLSRLQITVLTAALFSPIAAAGAQNVPFDAYMRGGRIHYQGGRFDRAREQFSNALAEYGAQLDDVKLAEVHLWLGLSQSQLRNYEAAAEHLDKALEADTMAARFIRQDEQREYWAWTALINTARQDYARGSYGQSLTYALAALKVSPDKPGTYTLIANSYNAMGRYDDMLSTARRMLTLDPASPDGLSLVGLYYLEQPDSLWPTELRQARWDSCAYYYQQAIEIYEKRFKAARAALGEKLKLTDAQKLNKAAWTLVEKSRIGDQQDLKNYIEKELAAPRQLSEVALVASQLFYAANNLNVSSSRAGSAMLRAAAETKGDVSVRFRAAAEGLFAKALEYDPTDFTAMFNLGIAQYQSQNDSLAQATFQKVIDGAVVPLSVLPKEWQEKLLALITAAAAKEGNLSLEPALVASVDSILLTRGYHAAGYRWFYFPHLRDKSQPVPVSPDDAAQAFISLQAPQPLENIYLLLGVTQTGMALSLLEAKRKDEAMPMFQRAIASLLMVTKLDPKSAEAYQSLVHCFRETDQKKKAEEAYKKFKELSR